MLSTVYVSNISLITKEQQFKDLLAGFNHDTRLIFPLETESGSGKGFCFVEVDPTQAAGLVDFLSGQSLDGRALRANLAEQAEGNSAPTARPSRPSARDPSGARRSDLGGARSSAGSRGSQYEE